MMVGVTIPNFHERKARGDLLPHTPFSQTEWRGRFVSGSFSSKSLSGADKDNTFTATNYNGPSFTSPPIAYRIDDFVDYDCDLVKPGPRSDYHQSLLQRASAKIYHQGWDALTSGAEAHKLGGLFRQVAQHVVNFRHHGVRYLYKNIRSGRNFNKFDPSALADAWLTYRYGVRPILYDLQDLEYALTEFDEKRTMFSERSGLTLTDNDSETLLSGHRQGHLTYDLTKITTATHSLRGSVTGRFKPARIVTNPVKTAWELVPFSFVVDWVVDIGSYLDSLSFRSLSSEWAASTGVQTDWNVSFVLSGYGNSRYSGSANAEWVYEGTYQGRSPASISNLPQVRYNPFNAFQLADIVALLKQTGKYR
jgi:hypothetical protein